MLKYRLLFGILMTVLFTAIVIFDGWIDGSLTASTVDDKPLQGTILTILIAILIIPAQLEFTKLAAAKNLKVFTTVATISSILLAGTWYWPQFIEISTRDFLFFVLTFALLGLVLCQYLYYGTSGMLANCGASCLSIVYMGVLSGFVPAIRIDFGLWEVLMFVFVVKASDIGAYAVGRAFGKHKFSPQVSPAKTWEGLFAAIITAVVVALALAAAFDIMVWLQAVIFGCCFALIAQIGDLVESMIKRDAQQKDSANNVPGFGGVLDIVDSPLLAAPFAYLFFMLSANCAA